MPKVESRLRFADYVTGRGRDPFRGLSSSDVKGVVAKCSSARYFPDGVRTWIRIKNPTYSQMNGRHELFDRRRGAGDSWCSPLQKPLLALD
jgi:ATP-dependent DNA ligase